MSDRQQYWLIGAVFAFALSVAFAVDRHRQSSGEARIKALYPQFSLGMSRDDAMFVLEREWNSEYVWTFKELATVSTPLTLGARNWIIYLEFEADKLVSIQVRTPDSSERHPQGAPGDLRVGET